MRATKTLGFVFHNSKHVRGNECELKIVEQKPRGFVIARYFEIVSPRSNSTVTSINYIELVDCRKCYF